MKRIVKISGIVMLVALAMIIVGSVLRGIAWDAEFDGSLMGVAFNNIGYIAFALSGVVLAGVGIVSTVGKDGCCNKDKNQENK